MTARFTTEGSQQPGDLLDQRLLQLENPNVLRKIDRDHYSVVENTTGTHPIGHDRKDSKDEAVQNAARISLVVMQDSCNAVQIRLFIRQVGSSVNAPILVLSLYL
jgi:hypothetical protein